MSLPSHGLLGDVLSPQMQLGDQLRTGQTWKVPSCNPFSPNFKDPLEILQATVEGREVIFWDGEMKRTWLVVYRSDPGSKLGEKPTDRQKLWVRRDGTVLKQQITVLGSSMTFVRMSDADSASLAEMEEMGGSEIEQL
jgi:hypothetical protein